MLHPVTKAIEKAFPMVKTVECIFHPTC